MHYPRDKIWWQYLLVPEGGTGSSTVKIDYTCKVKDPWPSVLPLNQKKPSQGVPFLPASYKGPNRANTVNFHRRGPRIM